MILIHYNDLHEEGVGNYFTKCAINAKGLLNNKNLSLTDEIKDNDCNLEFVMEKTKLLNSKSMFIIYSHGNRDSFSKKDEMPPFIWGNIICDNDITGSLIYTNACYTGQKLPEKIYKEKGVSFYGYDDEIRVPLIDGFTDEFLECENHALNQLLEGKTLQEAKRSASEKFEEKYLKYFKTKFLVAACYNKAKQNTKIHGDLNVKFFNN